MCGHIYFKFNIAKYSSYTDPIKITSIENSEHFTVITPVSDYTRILNDGSQLSIIVEFTPTAIGTTEENLQVNCEPVSGGSTIQAKGEARGPNLGLSAVSPLHYETYCYRRKLFEIPLTNTGEAELTISVSGPPSALFDWVPLEKPIPVNSSKVLKVTVWSDHLGDFSEPLTINGTYHMLKPPAWRARLKNCSSKVLRCLQKPICVTSKSER